MYTLISYTQNHWHNTCLYTLRLVVSTCDADVVLNHNDKSKKPLRPAVTVALTGNESGWCRVYLVRCPLLSVCAGLKVFPCLCLPLTSLYISSFPFSTIFSQKIVAANRSSISVRRLIFLPSLSCEFFSRSPSGTHTCKHFLTNTLTFLGLCLLLANSDSEP